LSRYVVMGVSGCGKSGAGRRLAAALGARFCEGDALHSPESVAKMAAGAPLEDADRWPWLDRVAERLRAGPPPVVVACSALKRAYRDRLRAGAGGDVRFLHLTGARDVIAARMAARTGHYMPVSLPDSQFAALEPPEADEAVTTFDIAQPIDHLVARMLKAIREDAR